MSWNFLILSEPDHGREIKIRNEISWLFIQHFGEQIKFHSEKELRTFSHDPSRYFNILSYLILSYLRSKETKDSANLTKDRSNRHEIRQESTFEGNTDPEKERYTRKWGFSPGTDIFTFILRPYRAALSHKHFLYRVWES